MTLNERYCKIYMLHYGFKDFCDEQHKHVMDELERELAVSKRAIAWADSTLACRELDIHPMAWEAAKEIKRLSR